MIYENGLPAKRNMATDAFLLDLAGQKTESPIIRIYGWDEPSITIGHHQRVERAVDISLLGKTPIVRRVTGGRALLHDDLELTYAVAGDFVRFGSLGADLSDSYHLIAQAIIAFYKTCGWTAEMARRDLPVSLSHARSLQKGCFATVSQYEITVGNAKVAAGSQRRSRNSFIQHGSIKLAVPLSHPAILDNSQDNADPPSPIVATSRNDLARRLITAFEQVYAVELIMRPFTDSEMQGIAARSGIFENLNPAPFSIEQESGRGSL